MTTFTLNRSFTLSGTFNGQGFPDQRLLAVDRGAFLAQVASWFEALSAGHEVGSVSAVVDGAAVAASGTITISGGSGTVGTTINGVLVQVAWTTSDTATAALLATAVNNSIASVTDLVTATSVAGVVTITSKFPGVAGNAVTLAGSGTGVTASGSRLSGGVAAVATTVTI